MKQSQLGQGFSSLLCQVEKYTNGGDQTLYPGFWVDSRVLLAMGTVSGRVCIYLYSGCCFGILSTAEKWQRQLGKRFHLDGTKYKGLYLVHWEMSVTTNVWTRRMSESRKRFLRKPSFSIKRDRIFFCCVCGYGCQLSPDSWQCQEPGDTQLAVLQCVYTRRSHSSQQPAVGMSFNTSFNIIDKITAHKICSD